ncbi:hypothetical protein J4E82_006119 [Alternaria postmessia]|uniref:uncharacterized protein n=1 Tax=Alternaria postmessia TaxID=1187938 RepID=UPI002224ABB7|nr:uncharacterized protein J4E82_006119 [Alternaria postmessia]KAI5375249.1 hypothetical protein J4E82_006119 [Alternaria postmessia]
MGDAASLSDNKSTLETAEADLDRSPAEEIFRRKLDPLKEKVAKLRTRRTDVGSECDQLSRFIAKKLCRTFADKFYVTLPRELREMVYDYVWDWAMLGLTFGDVTLYGNRQPSASEGDQSRALGHTLHARYLSLLRLVGTSMQNLTDLVYRDHFHLGVKPLDHVRHLEIPLRQDVLIGRGEQTRHKLQSMEGLEIFQHHLEVLLELRVKKGFQLTILLTWQSFYIYCMPALERSRAVVNKLLMEDAKIWKVRKDHRRKGYVSSHDDLGTFPSGLSFYEDLTDDAEKAAEREEWENDQDKVVLEPLVGLEGPTKSVPMSYVPSIPAHMGPNSPH